MCIRDSDWREFHHFCLTYDGPSRGGNSDLTFYFDGDKQWTENVLLDTAPEGTAMRLGTDATYNRPRRGALDEADIYASALDASAVAVLYAAVTAAPTVTDAPTGDFFEGSLVAYYPFDYPFDDFLRDAAGAHHAWLLGESPAAAVGKDRGGALLVGDAGFLELPAAVTEDIGRDYDRTICVLARIDSWAGGYLFEYGGADEACDGEGLSLIHI